VGEARKGGGGNSTTKDDPNAGVTIVGAGPTEADNYTDSGRKNQSADQESLEGASEKIQSGGNLGSTAEGGGRERKGNSNNLMRFYIVSPHRKKFGLYTGDGS